MARASGPALTAAGKFPGSRGHAELGRRRGGGPQGCPETPRRERCPRTHPPRSPLWEGTPLYAAGDGQARTRGAGALTPTLPVPALRGADPIPGRGPGAPTRPAAAPPSSRSLPNFPAPTGRRAPPTPRAGAPPRRAEPRPGRRETGCPGRGGGRAWAAPGPGRRSPGWLQSLGKMVPRLLLAQSISARRSPGARGARASPRGRTHLPAATCARRRPRGKLCGPRGEGGRRRPPVPGRSPPPSPARPPARALTFHGGEQRQQQQRGPQPPQGHGCASRGLGPRLRGARAARARARAPGSGGRGGAARRGAHTAAATAQPAE